MERLTSNKAISDMSMIELAYNCCYADNDGNARYRNYELDIDSRKFVRSLIKDICEDDLSDMTDAEFDEYMSEMLSIEPDSQIGLLALFYRNLWAMADLRERLKYYEDLELDEYIEQGRLLKLPCSIGDKLYWIDTEDDEGNVCLCIKRYEDYEPVVGFSKYKNGKLYVHIGYEDNPPLEIGSVYALLTIEDAERKLEELKFKNAYMKLSEKVRGEE